MSGWRIGLWVMVVALVLWFLYLVRGVLLPCVLGWVIAIMLEPLVVRLRLRGMSPGVATGILTLAFFGTATYIVILLTPTVTGQVTGVRDKVQVLTEGLAQGDARNNAFTSWSPSVRMTPPGPFSVVDDFLASQSSLLERAGLPSTRQAFMDQYVEPQRAQITRAVQGFFNGFLGLLAGAAQQVLLLAITPLVVFYLLSDIDKLRKGFVGYIPPGIRGSVVSVLEDVGEVMRSYFRGMTLLITLYIIVTAIWLGVMGVPFFILIAVLAGVLYLIPIFGGLLNATMIFLVTFLSGANGPGWITFQSPLAYAVVVTVGFFILASVGFDNILVPRIVGGAVNLHPVSSLFVVSAMGALFGLPGMVIAFPLAGSVKVILERVIRVTNQGSTTLASLPPVPLRHR